MIAPSQSHTSAVLGDFAPRTDAQRPVDRVRTRGRSLFLGAAIGVWVVLLVSVVLALLVHQPMSPLSFLGRLTVAASTGAVLGLIAHRGRRRP
jgi:hypothetical protein